jgi:adenylate kinase family enzyme
MQRICIIGTTGSGKTTVAAEVARILGSVPIELDALNWQPGWVLVPSDRFRQDVARALETPRWVTDGNYRSVRDLVWERADCLVWLDYPLSLIVTRLIRRTARRIWNSESCCNGNQESLRRAFSRESIILWALQTHGRLRREYPPLLCQFAERGKTVVIHRSPRETRAWLDKIRLAQRAITSKGSGNSIGCHG